MAREEEKETCRLGGACIVSTRAVDRACIGAGDLETSSDGERSLFSPAICFPLIF